jgi:hypothetical protein
MDKGFMVIQDPLGSCLEVSYFCNDLVLGHYHTQNVTL